MSKHVFISYNQRDRQVADAVRVALEAVQIGCWIAPRDVPPGANYAVAIPSAIETTQIFVLLLSEGSQASAHVPREVELASRRGKRIIPVRLDQTKLSGAFEYYLSNVQAIDALGVPIEQPLPALIHAVRESLPHFAVSQARVALPDTPAASLVGSHTLSTAYVPSAVDSPLWRGERGFPTKLRFHAPPDRFIDDASDTLALTLDAARPEFRIGRRADADPPNDLVLPHRTVSRRSITLLRRGKTLVVRRAPECTVPVRVGLSVLEGEEECALFHGQIVSIGVVGGVFLDGRYVPDVTPAGAVDEATGFLGREGLAWEIALAANERAERELVLVRPTGFVTNDALARRAAAALHAWNPVAPVARFGNYAAMLLPPGCDPKTVHQMVVAGTNAAMTLGVHPLGGVPEEACLRIDEARGALARLAKAGAGGVVSLKDQLLVVQDLDSFSARAHEALAQGGEVGLLVIERLDEFRRGDPKIFRALEQELVQLTGRIAGNQIQIAVPAPGVVALASMQPVEAHARMIAAEWRARGPIRSEALELERSAAVQILTADDVTNLSARIESLASADELEAGIEGLPLPIAYQARVALAEPTLLGRARAALLLVHVCYRFMSMTFASMALADATMTADDLKAITALDGQDRWSTLALLSAKTLSKVPGRVAELAQSLFGPNGPCPGLAKAESDINELAAGLIQLPDAATSTGTSEALVAAQRALLWCLRALRGWSLISVTDVVPDLDGEAQTVYFVDYTGSFLAGTPRRLTLIRDPRVGSFTYLARFGERIAVPLEPLLRRRLCPICHTQELFWATRLVTKMGRHSYEGVANSHRTEAEVDRRQLPRALRNSMP